MRSISHASTDVRMSSSGTSGEKQLVKALTAIVNREGNKKIMEEGKTTKVRKPSSRQLEKNYPPPKWKKFERPLKPSVK